MWSLWQYKRVFDEALTSCSQELQELIIRRSDRLVEEGNLCKRPISAPLGDGLFELRGRGNGQHIRFIYFFWQDNKIVFVHACDHFSNHEREIALRNKKVVEEGRERAYGVDFTH